MRKIQFKIVNVRIAILQSDNKKFEIKALRHGKNTIQNC